MSAVNRQPPSFVPTLTEVVATPPPDAPALGTHSPALAAAAPPGALDLEALRPWLQAQLEARMRAEVERWLGEQLPLWAEALAQTCLERLAEQGVLGPVHQASPAATDDGPGPA